LNREDAKSAKLNLGALRPLHHRLYNDTSLLPVNNISLPKDNSMLALYQRLAEDIAGWRTRGYPTEAYPALAEILDYRRDPDTAQSRYLREAQRRVLETYWYLRLPLGTPHILDLYHRLYPKPRELREALRDVVEDVGMDGLIERIRTDDDAAPADPVARAHRFVTDGS